MNELTGKRAFVTGGTRGIGRATATLLTRGGAGVAVTSRTQGGDAGGAAPANAGGANAINEAGGLDILVVNHGVWPADDVPLSKMSDAQWESTRRANLDAMFYICRAAIAQMSSGTIVLVSSTAGQRGEAYHADYAATKGAGISPTKSLAVELAPEITVNCVAPGWVDTEMSRPAFGMQEAGRGERALEATR